MLQQRNYNYSFNYIGIKIATKRKILLKNIDL